MKITDVKATALKTRQVFVQVHTDEGFVGVGECSPQPPVEVSAHFVNVALKPLVVGEDPLQVERVWGKMFYGTRTLGDKGVQGHAIAGVDIALWDILGKVSGLPACKLLGGCYQDKVLMYASVGGGDAMSPDQMARKVEGFLHDGFKAVKLRMHWGPQRQDVNPRKDYEMFKAVRHLVGDDFPLSFDVNNGYSVPTAIAQGRRLEELGIFHYEEPVPQYDYPGIAQVADALDVPVSAGEQEYTLWQFRDLITQAKVDIIQPDVVKCGGITAMRKIAVLAETYDRHFVPHQVQVTVALAANLHVIASIRAATRPQEYGDIGYSTRRQVEALFKAPLTFEDGYVHVPQAPGLGLELIEAKLKELAL